MLTALGGAALLLLGYLLGRWQDTPAAQAPPVLVTAPASAPAPASATPETTTASPQPAPTEYAVLQAEAATELAGVGIEDTSDEGGGKNIGWINRDDFLRFDDVDFGAVPATRAAIRVSSGSGASSRLQIRLDSRDSAPVGEISVGNSGGWQSWGTTNAVLKPVTGVHTVYLTFSSSDGTELMNINWLRFGH
ncbi:hypothetical protein GCM10025331_12680 [Actinoplanes utahensis]|nr:hypothetical protein Aut01nite_19910 [Actinoplanes utahensis]